MKAMMKSIVLKTLGGVTATALTVAGIAVPMSVRSAQNAADASTALPLATEIAAEAETVKTDVPISKVAVETGNMDIAVESAKDTLAQAADESAKDALAQTADTETTVSRTVGRAASYSGAASGGRTENPSAVSNKEREKSPAENKTAIEQSEKVAAEKAAAEKAAAEKAAAEKAAAEKAAAEKAAAEKAAAEKAAAEKAAAEKAAAEKAAAEKAAADAAAQQAGKEWMDSCIVQSDEAILIFGDPEEEEQPKVAHYHCNCGYSSTDYEEFTRVHMYNHVINGERYSYCTTYE